MSLFNRLLVSCSGTNHLRRINHLSAIPLDQVDNTGRRRLPFRFVCSLIIAAFILGSPYGLSFSMSTSIAPYVCVCPPYNYHYHLHGCVDGCLCCCRLQNSSHWHVWQCVFVIRVNVQQILLWRVAKDCFLVIVFLCCLSLFCCCWLRGAFVCLSVGRLIVKTKTNSYNNTGRYYTNTSATCNISQ